MTKPFPGPEPDTGSFSRAGSGTQIRLMSILLCDLEKLVVSETPQRQLCLRVLEGTGFAMRGEF